jgi:hypothetical protein
MSQDITYIECKKIKFANGRKGLANAVLDTLYDSISKEGLHQAIGLRPDPNSPGYYEIVYGRHRFYVVSKMCKDEVIKAQVYEDMTEEEAELATLTENACRTHAKPNDRLLVLRQWQDVYRKNFPHLEGEKASGGSRWANSTKAVAKQAAVDVEKAADEAAQAVVGNSSVHAERSSSETDNQVTAAPADVAAEPERKPMTFRERVKAATGISNAQLTRDLKINEGLTEEQMWGLGVVQCTKAGMLSIIDASPDLGKRGEIVNLVVSGMEVELAIKEVVGTKEPATTVKVVGTVEAKPGAELTDEEWFLKSCGSFNELLSDNDQYKADAILWRQINDARHKFRKAAKKIVEAHRTGRKGKKFGWFSRSLYQVLNVSHPNDWLTCGECGGRGMVDPGIECKACQGACYRTKTERYP